MEIEHQGIYKTAFLKSKIKKLPQMLEKSSLKSSFKTLKEVSLLKEEAALV